MFGPNWKPRLGALAGILAALADIIHGLTTTGATINWTLDFAALSTGFGLLFAKSHDVTGGAVLQPTPAVTLIAKEEEKAEAGVKP